MNKELYVACINVARDVVEHLEALAESHCYEQPHLSNAGNNKVTIAQRHANNQNNINTNTNEPIINTPNKECDALKEQNALDTCCQKNNLTHTQEVELMRLNVMKELVQQLFLCTYSWAQKQFTPLEQATEDYCLLRVNELTSIVLRQQEELEEQQKLRQLLTQGRKENVNKDNDLLSLSTASPSQKITTRRRSLKCPAIAEVLKRVQLLLYLSTADQIERFADNENSALRTQLQMAQQANTSFLNLIHNSCDNVKCLQVHEQSPSLLFRRLFRQEQKLQSQEQEHKYAECSNSVNSTNISDNNKFTETSKQNDKCALQKETSNVMSDVPPHVTDDSDDAASSASYAFEAIVDDDDDDDDDSYDANQIANKECNNTITKESGENERKTTEKTAPIPSEHKSTKTKLDNKKEKEEIKQELSNAIKTVEVKSVLEKSKYSIEPKLNGSIMCSNVTKPDTSNYTEWKANIQQHFKNNNKEVRLKEIAKMQLLLQLLMKYGKVDYNICDFTFDKYMVRECSKNETQYCFRVYASVPVHSNDQCQASNTESNNNENMNSNSKVCSVFLYMTSYYNNLQQARKMAMLEVAWKLMPYELVAFAFYSSANVDKEIKNFVNCKLQSCSPHTSLRAESELREKLTKVSLLKESELTAHHREEKEYKEDTNNESKHEARMPKFFQIEKFSKVCFVEQALRLLTMCKEPEESKENDVHVKSENNLEAMDAQYSECENKANTRIPLTFAWSVEELRSSRANTSNESNYDNTDGLEYYITIIHIPTNEVYGSSTNNWKNNVNCNEFPENKEITLASDNENKQNNSSNNNTNECPRRSCSFFCALIEALVNAARRCNVLELFHKLCDEFFSTQPPPVGTIYEAALFYLRLAFNLQVSKKCNTPLESLVEEAISQTENNMASGAVVMEYTNESREIYTTLEMHLTRSQQFISQPFYNVRLSTGRGINKIVARETCAKQFCVKNLYTIFANTLKELSWRKQDESKEAINKICNETSQQLKVEETKKKMNQVGLSKAITDCKTKSIDVTWYETMWNDV